MARLKDLLLTWRGRLFLVNLALFVYVSWRSQSLFMPDTATLIAVGAKDPVRLAAGEWWRLLTPVFIHVGVLHFALNSYMLDAVGRQIEQTLGGAWFIAIYLVSGLAGNVSSALFSANLSAGASGAIFGLLGAGLCLELSIGARVRAVTGRRPPRGAYLTTVAMNLAFGFIVPFIDNTAHLGGLFAGFALAFAMMRVRANQLAAKKPWVGYLAIAGLSAVLVAGALVGTSKGWVTGLLARAAKNAGETREKVFYLSQYLDVAPEDIHAGVDRARLLFQMNEPRYALYDVQEALKDPRGLPLVQSLADELSAGGKLSESAQVRKMIEQR